MKKIFLLTLVLLFSFTLGFSQGFWTQKLSMPGYSRCSGIGLATTTRGYVVGGYLGGYDHFKDCWEYNPTTNVWLQKADFPGAKRRWVMGFVINDKVYIGLGGFMNGPSNYTYYSDFYEYNPATNTWTAKANFPGTPRVSAFCFEENGKGYVGGGLNGTTVLNDLWRYNPVTDNWVQKNNITCGARWAAICFTAGKVAYIGLGKNTSTYFNDLWQYDPSNDTWLQKTNFPGNARWYAAAFGIDNYGYMGTGANGSSYYKNFWQYNTTTDTWTSIPDLTGSVRLEAVSFSINNKGYVGTGATSSTTYTNDLWEYTPSWYGVTENDNATEYFAIYPNPVTESLSISLNPKNTFSEIWIYDLNGKLVLQKKLDAKQKEILIDFNSFAKGKYFIRLGGKEITATKTFVKL